MFSSQFMEGPPANGGDPTNLLSSQFTGASPPVQIGEPVHTLLSEYTGAAWPIYNDDLECAAPPSYFSDVADPAFSSEFFAGVAPLARNSDAVQSEFSSGFFAGVAPLARNSDAVQSEFSSGFFAGVSPPAHNSDAVQPAFSSRFFTGVPLPAHNSTNFADSAFSSRFPGAATPSHDGGVESLSSSQFSGLPEFSSQFHATPDLSDNESVLKSHFTVAAPPSHDGGLDPMFSGQFIEAPSTAQSGYPKSVFWSQLQGTAAPVYDDGPTSIFSRERTATATPLNDGHRMFLLRSQHTREAALGDGRYPIPAFQSQLVGAAVGDPSPIFTSQCTEAPTLAHGGGDSMWTGAPVVGGNPVFAFSRKLTGEVAGGYPMPMLPNNQLMGWTPAPAMFWMQNKQASAPAHGGDRMSMFGSQINGAPAPKPWTREELLFEQVPKAYPNHGTHNGWRAVGAKIPPWSSVENIKGWENNLHENAGKTLVGTLQSPSWGNLDGIVDKGRYQNFAGGDGSYAVVPSLPAATNLVLPPPPQCTPAKRGKVRKKKKRWTEDEHRWFLRGLGDCEEGDWKRISREYVKTRTPGQVASHAQKYFIRLRAKERDEGQGGCRTRTLGRRKSIHDITLDD